jgi:hypothetical protein
MGVVTDARRARHRHRVLEATDHPKERPMQIHPDTAFDLARLRMDGTTRPGIAPRSPRGRPSRRKSTKRH